MSVSKVNGIAVPNVSKVGMVDISLFNEINGIDLYDTDAAAYIARVEGASGDNQALEASVKMAINKFVIGCKLDGIWSAIKASCILAGARTLNGALQPLVGTAPTNANFVSGDYNRKTGLVGDGSTKYLNSNRNNNADPQNSRHLAVYANLQSSASIQLFLGGRSAGSGVGASFMGFNTTGSAGWFRSIPDTDGHQTSGSMSVGVGTLIGESRSASGSYTARVSGSSATISSTSTTPNNINLFVFCQNNQGTAASFTNARLAFYSIGESLDLAKLDTRVSALITTLGAAIP